MRILIVSDSHGVPSLLRSAVERESGCSLVIHLGDGARDTDFIRDIPLLQVRGNCDLCCDLPVTLLTQEGGKTILCTHGHTQMVKYGTQTLHREALDKHADIALYGHTHVPVQTYTDGLYLCNPGSLLKGDYAVLEIVPGGVMWLPKRIL